MTILNVVISFFNIKNLFDFTQEFTRFVQSRGVHLSGILEPVQRGLATHATACPKCFDISSLGCNSKPGGKRAIV
jgi:hypothetical protein